MNRRSFLTTGLALPAAGVLPEKAAEPKLKYRVLGKTGLKVTEVGFGSEAVSDASVIARAVDLGINFFDTARSYEGGGNERALAAGLGAKRKNVIIATRSYGGDKKTIAADLDTSLKELKTDYVDIWYIGNKDTPQQVSQDMLDFQREAQRAGKIRFRGLSMHRTWGMLEYARDTGKFDVVMVPYNFAIGTRKDPFKMDATQLDFALGELQKAGIGAVAMKVMAGGYRDKNAPKDALEDVHKRPNAFVSALRWALRTPAIQTTSVTMRDHDQLIENMQAMAAPFSESDARTLTAHLEYIGPMYCRMCYQCDGGCPEGLPVADVLRFLMYADGYRRFDIGYSRFSRLAEDVRSIRCADCRQCAVTCPNGVAVKDRLIRAQQLFG